MKLAKLAILLALAVGPAMAQWPASAAGCSALNGVVLQGQCTRYYSEKAYAQEVANRNYILFTVLAGFAFLLMGYARMPERDDDE